MAEAVTAQEEGRAQVMHRSLGRCEIQAVPDCRVSDPQWHHRQLRRSHDHRPSNGLAACIACHTHIHDVDRAGAESLGWIVSQSDDPATTPALIHPRGEPQAGWFLLSEGGTYL